VRQIFLARLSCYAARNPAKEVPPGSRRFVESGLCSESAGKGLPGDFARPVERSFGSTYLQILSRGRILHYLFAQGGHSRLAKAAKRSRTACKALCPSPWVTSQWLLFLDCSSASHSYRVVVGERCSTFVKA
jgi:hypothetical protein